MAGLVLLTIGTLWGDDHHFPFGPMRMYSTRNDPNKTVNVVVLRATTEDGHDIRLISRRFGLRPAEINGQITRFADERPLARLIARAYERLDGDPPITELRLIHGFHQLKDGLPVDYWEEVLATWRK